MPTTSCAYDMKILDADSRKASWLAEECTLSTGKLPSGCLLNITWLLTVPLYSSKTNKQHKSRCIQDILKSGKRFRERSNIPVNIELNGLLQLFVCDYILGPFL